MSGILAQATVDPHGIEDHWRVTVEGFRLEPPLSARRTYTIKAKSDNDAAQQGLRRFEEEMAVLDLSGST